MKLTTERIIIIALILLFAWYMGFLPIGYKAPQPPEQTTTPITEVAVNKNLKFAVIDKWAGSAVASATIYLYDLDKKLLETLTTASDGTATTALTYKSGTQLYVYILKSNSKLWKKITVPTMAPADAEALTYNPIRLDFFTICSGSDSLMDNNGNTWTDGSTYYTSNGTTPQFTYSFYVSTDNTGFIESYDPLKDTDWKAVVWMELSGTGYTKVIVTGFDGGFEKGTTMYYYKLISPDEITKYKVGNTYILQGAMTVTFNLDLTGLSSGDSVTMQLYLYVYDSPDYMSKYGSHPSEAVQLAEQTVTLTYG